MESMLAEKVKNISKDWLVHIFDAKKEPLKYIKQQYSEMSEKYEIDTRESFFKISERNINWTSRKR